MVKIEKTDSIFKIDLNDKESIIIDDSGKSIGCFAVKNNVAIDSNTIKELKTISHKLGKKDIRICLHNNRNSNLHNMINLIYKKEENIPHKHVHKSEIYHIIKGRMTINIYNKNGEIVDKCLLDGEKTFLYRVGKDTFHTTVPETEYVIFHETRRGPFPEDCDSVFLYDLA